ncbi:putative metal-binding motif-containing protein [Hyalangium rubrum]|uniref:Metal-binding motif-containing protein n=1 Tax=Hyalangium rubrum TaxID=3103134 RepID=A0ABU5H1W9_9BACT|nr:putative metal-binding motif-containing protein [Hyalangium sp. s54d21]MDY7226768.1 putative metal-binding motif-containing protein [Hyalangium sp. s54d21]
MTYTFKAGCITVVARDAEASEQQVADQVAVLARGPSTVRFAVYREESWSHSLDLTITAREQSCEGPVVAEQLRKVELRKARVESLAITLEAPDTDGDGYVPTTHGGTDCDDSQGSVHPAATEVCDNLDNDCDGTPDQGVGPLWYPDQDGDTFGDSTAAPIRSCTQPASTPRYVQDNTDCRDSNDQVYPRASSAPETLCDEVDDDCDGQVDDGFALKGAGCSEPCSGQYVCNASRNALACNGPVPDMYYQDADNDGAGTPSTAVTVCPGTPPPAGTVPNALDCDDQDPLNRHERTEACDGRDNTCDGQRDEDNACDGKGWKASTDAALTGNRDWKTVALGNNGLPVWVAGMNGVLAFRNAATGAFTSRDGTCNNRNWRAAWVRPVDGHVFLVGDAGYLAEHTGTACVNATRVTTNNDLTGIIGFDTGTTTTLYVVDDRGRLYAWTPGSTPQERYNTDPPTYFGIHGLASTQLLVVGGRETAPFGPHIVSYPGTGATAAAQTLNSVPGGYGGSLRAVWMGVPGLAYAVGDDGLIMKWNGTSDWERIAPPDDAPTADFTSVVVLDAASIYVTDTDGRIRLRNATRWLDPPLQDADRALWDIALSSPRDVWAVGEDGLVLHFAE